MTLCQDCGRFNTNGLVWCDNCHGKRFPMVPTAGDVLAGGDSCVQLRKTVAEQTERIRQLTAERDEARAEGKENFDALLDAERSRDEWHAKYEAERQARERAEAELAKFSKAHHSASIDLEDARADAAAMRAALEDILKWPAKEAHDIAEAALSSDAGASLLAFARAAPDALREALWLVKRCEPRHEDIEAKISAALALAAPIEGILKGGGE